MRSALGSLLLALTLGVACTSSVSPSSAASPSPPIDVETSPAWRDASVADDEVCALASAGWVWCWRGAQQHGFDLDAIELAGLGAVREPLWWDPYGGAPAEAMTCALQREGRVVCWSAKRDPWVVPGLFGVDAIEAHDEAICARVEAMHVCFDSASPRRWFYEAPNMQPSDARSCSLTDRWAVVCEHASGTPDRFVRAPEGRLRAPELVYDDDGVRRWAQLRAGRFEPVAERLPASERVELARALLPAAGWVCLASEDTNGQYEWAEVPKGASLYDPCRRRELLGWALAQFEADELARHIDVLLDILPTYDHRSAQALLEATTRLRGHDELVRDVVLWVHDTHPHLADAWAHAIAPSHAAAAVKAGMSGAVVLLDPLRDEALLVQLALDAKQPVDMRLAAIGSLDARLHLDVFETLADDDDCQVAMDAAQALFDAGGRDLRPPLDSLDELELGELAFALCQLSWSDLVPEDFEVPSEVYDYSCTGDDDEAICEFDTTSPYDVDTHDPAFSLRDALDWSRFELVLERTKGRWRVVSADTVWGNDCTNC